MSSDIHALTGAYAVDGLDDVERARFERHLAECDSCRDEVDGLREAAALLVTTTPVTPPASLRDRVLADIDTVRPLPPVLATRPERGRTSIRRRFPALVAAAVALIVLGGSVATVWHPWADDEKLSAADAVIQAEDAEKYQADVGDATATVFRSKSLNRAVIVTNDMPDAPAGYDYVLWFDRGGDMEVDSTMPDGPDNKILMDGDAATADGVGITIEREGVLPSEPSDDEVAVLGFEQA